MAYSRYGESTWYTFWAANSAYCRYKWPTKQLKNNQVFQICDLPSFTFTYGKLQKAGIGGIISKVEKFYSKDHTVPVLKDWKDEPVYVNKTYKAKKPSADEITELIKYIREWEDDVNRHFRFWTFIKYEWVYPITNDIRWKLRKVFNKVKIK